MKQASAKGECGRMINQIVGYLFSVRRYPIVENHNGHEIRIDASTDLVKCPDCMGSPTAPNEIAEYNCPLYEVNIFPYKQTCHICGKIIVEGRTEKWCELYTK